jgi:hypothetical protein
MSEEFNPTETPETKIPKIKPNEQVIKEAELNRFADPDDKMKKGESGEQWAQRLLEKDQEEVDKNKSDMLQAAIIRDKDKIQNTIRGKYTEK